MTSWQKSKQHKVVELKMESLVAAKDAENGGGGVGVVEAVTETTKCTIRDYDG